MATSVEELYELCEKLDAAKESIAQHVDEYQKVIAGTKGGVLEKKLACQLIVRFYHKLPEQRLRALDALFALCEDEDVNIRKVVIKELPSLCKDGYQVDKVADVLTQLLQTDNTHEQSLVQSALLALLTAYPAETLKTIFGNIVQAEEELVRERAIQLLATKIRALPASVLTRPIEDLILIETKKVLVDVTCEEFLLFMHLLQGLPHLQTLAGRQSLLQLILDQADIDKPFPVADADRIDQVLHCLKQATPYLSKNVSSNRMLLYLLDSAIPNLNAIRAVVDGADLEILRLLAEFSPFAASLPDLKSKMAPLIKLLIDTMPLPPSEQNGGSSSATNGDDEHAQMKISEIEALLYILHQFGKHDSSTLVALLTNDENKELRKRMQYLARLVQVYSTKMKTVLAKVPKNEAGNDENKIKLIALRTSTNITTLLRDLLLLPPQFKSTVVVSWKPIDSALKRKAEAPPTATLAPRVKGARREERGVYAPPSGKFSEKAGSFQDGGDNWSAGLFRGRAGLRGGGGRRGRGGRGRGGRF